MMIKGITLLYFGIITIYGDAYILRLERGPS